MIIVNLMGGLGNQLFQYAAAYSLAKYKGVELKLNIDGFEHDRLRDFALSPYALSEKIASDHEKKTLSFWHKRPLDKVWFIISQGLRPYYMRSSFKEATMMYDSNFFKARTPVFLQGYWQSPRYFEHLASELRELLVPAGPFPPTYREVEKMMKLSHSASVHIRRGDYVNDPTVKRVLGTCTPEYYLRAVQRLKEEEGVDHLFFFSDDMAWVKENMEFEMEMTFVGRSLGLTETQEMHLMSACDHHIIANSSFSWWGAWLNPSTHKKVVAPSNWFADPKRDPKDIVPDEWIRM